MVKEERERVCYKLITPSNIIYNSIIFNILHFLQTLDSLVFSCFTYSKDWNV